MTRASTDHLARSSALERGPAILEYVSRQGPYKAANVAMAANLRRSPTYRLGLLRDCGFLERGGDPEQLRIEGKVADLGLANFASSDVVRIGARYLCSLAMQAQKDVLLGVADQGEIVCLAREGGGTYRVLVSADRRATSNLRQRSREVLLSPWPGNDLEDRLSRLSYRRPSATRSKVRCACEPTWTRRVTADTRWTTSRARKAWSVSPAPLRDGLGRGCAMRWVAGPADRLAAKESEEAALLRQAAAAMSRRAEHRP